MAKLTDGKSGSIARAKPPEKGQRLLFDDHRNAPRGFGLRVTAAGGKAFILKYTFEGTQRRKTIGDWPTWSLEAARDEARALRLRIDQGSDPLQDARRRRAEPTVAEVVRQYVGAHVSGLSSERAITRYFERDLVPRLGRYKICDITRRDLIEVVEAKAANTPTAAKHLLVYIKGLFDWAVDREYLTASPAASIRPKSIATPGAGKNPLRSNQRKRILDSGEIRAFWQCAETCGIHQLTALALKLVLLTGQRPGEVAGMHESELTGNTWIIPATRRLKTETEQRVPLTREALEVVERAREEVLRLSVRRKCKPSGYLFEARPGTPLGVGALSKALGRYAEALGSRDVAPWGHWRPHDLRRTARTGLTACGFPQEIAERVIGHAAQGIIDVYNQHDYDAEKRAALEAWERRLMAIVSNTETPRVVPIGRASA